MRRWNLIAVALLVSLAGCETMGRAILPATLGDLDQVEAKITHVAEEQRDAYLQAKADGHEDPTRAAFDAGAEVADKPAQTGSLMGILSVVLQALGYGGAATALTTAASRKRRGVSVLTGKKPPRTRAKA